MDVCSVAASRGLQALWRARAGVREWEGGETSLPRCRAAMASAGAEWCALLADPIVVEDVDSDSDGESEGKKPKMAPAPKPKRPAPTPIDMPIVSLVQDPGNAINFFAGTQDGRIVSLQVRGEKHRVRCSVLHQMHVAAAATSKDPPTGIYLGALKGYLFAVPAPCELSAPRAHTHRCRVPLHTCPCGALFLSCLPLAVHPDIPSMRNACASADLWLADTPLFSPSLGDARLQHLGRHAPKATGPLALHAPLAQDRTAQGRHLGLGIRQG